MQQPWEYLREKLYGSVRVRDDFHIRTNTELHKFLYDIDIVQRINIQRPH